MLISPKLKVCGLTKPDQIHELISMNTDFLGFIFYKKSPRYVLDHLSLNEIFTIKHPGKTGVFVNEKVDNIIEIAEKAGLNFIQLHGDEDEIVIPDIKKKLNPEIKIIKVIRVGTQIPEIRKQMERIINLKPSTIDYLLFDTDSQVFGGTGKSFNWNMLNEIEIPLPYFLSGGISEENIENIQILNKNPFALDINSKFEIAPGIKNLGKVKTFKKHIKTSSKEDLSHD